VRDVLADLPPRGGLVAGMCDEYGGFGQRAHQRCASDSIGPRAMTP